MNLHNTFVPEKMFFSSLQRDAHIEAVLFFQYLFEAWSINVRMTPLAASSTHSG